MVPDDVNITPMTEPTTDLSAAQDLSQQEQQPERRTYEARLFQVAEFHTETWTLEAENQAEAQAQVDEILSTKEFDGVEHRVELTDVTPAPEEVTPEATPETETPTEAPAPAEGQ